MKNIKEKERVFEKSDNLHLIGIGGTGMSGLARLLLSLNKKVSGSDNNVTPVIDELKKKGAKIYKGQKKSNLKSSTEAVIYSHAVFEDNPEYIKAVELGIPMLSYPEAVGLIMRRKRGIAVAGTHGKTTTSSLIVSVMISAGLPPSFLLGGDIRSIGNSGVGDNDFLVVEACEYKRSFLNYNPEIAVLTNIEKDHLDYYEDLNEIKSAFKKFVRGVKKDGAVIYCAEDVHASAVARSIKHLKKMSYGISKGELRAQSISFMKDYTRYECFAGKKKLGIIKSRAQGFHNVLNSLAAASCAFHIGIPFSDIKEGIENFNGVHRRCEFLGSAGGVTVIDDYGHHPTEITYTLKSVREMFPRSRLIVVFQPHQYSRTRILLKEFAESFELADKIVVPDIYFVRDSILEKRLVNAEMLVEKIRKNGREALYLPSFSEIVEYLGEIASRGDVILTVGAGPVDTIAKDLLKRLSDSK